jgi:hypothetical protein
MAVDTSSFNLTEGEVFNKDQQYQDFCKAVIQKCEHHNGSQTLFIQQARTPSSGPGKQSSGSATSSTRRLEKCEWKRKVHLRCTRTDRSIEVLDHQ